MSTAVDYQPTIEDFEAGRVDPERFDHAAHIYVAWLYVDAYPLPDAISRFTAALRRLTLQIGAPGKYHETISWFFLLLIAERRQRSTGDWESFRRENADLFCRSSDLLRRYYSPAVLSSRRARESFVLPDRAPAEAA